MKSVPLVSNRLVKSVAIFSCIQALLWVGLAISGLLFYNCTIDVEEKNPATLLSITYFYNTECRSPPKYLEGLWGPDETPRKTMRTHTAIVWFLVSGCVRGVASLVLAVAAGMRKRLATASGVFFWCWLLVEVACIIVDAVYAIIYAIDGSDTKSLADLLDDDRLEGFPDTGLLWALAVPPIIMALACSRFVILWLVDVILVFVAIVGACRARSSEEFVSPPNAARQKNDVPLRYTAAKSKNPTATEEEAVVAAIAAIAAEEAAAIGAARLSNTDPKFRASSNHPEYEPVGPSVSAEKPSDQLEMAESSKSNPYYSPVDNASGYEPVGKPAEVTANQEVKVHRKGSKVDAGMERNSNVYVNAPASTSSQYEHVYEHVDDYGTAVGAAAIGSEKKEREQRERLDQELMEQERWRQERKEEERQEHDKLEQVRREQESREQELQRRAMEEREAVAEAAAAAAAIEQERRERERKEKERELRERWREREAAAERARKEREATDREQREQELLERARITREKTVEAALAADAERRPKSGSIISNSSGTAELHNQKPWSYFRPPLEELSERRLSPAKLNLRIEEVEKPPVPVPDYNIFSPVEKNANVYSTID